MKIVHVQASVQSSSNAPYRLHTAMLANGLDSYMLVMNTIKSNSINFHAIKHLRRDIQIYSYAFMMSFVRKKMIKFPWLYSLPYCVGGDISQNSLILNADVIYLHWINGGFLTLNNIRKLLLLKKPIIVFTHDMWFVTGGCHHSFECEGYKLSCDRCPMFDTNKIINFPSLQLADKSKLYRDFDNLHFVSPSHWMASCVRQSFVSRDKDVYVIPNAVNEAVFKRIDKKYSRYILDIDLNKKIISFGCNAGINNPIKGWNILLESLRILKEKYMYENIQVVIFGSEFDNSAKEDCPYPIEFLGIVNDEVTMSIINCAADVFVTPSLAESFGMTALENIYCGTPVVAYNHGGVVDFIQHKVNGYLSEYKSAEDMARGVLFCLENDLPMTISPEFLTLDIILKHKEIIGSIINGSI